MKHINDADNHEMRSIYHVIAEHNFVAVFQLFLELSIK